MKKLILVLISAILLTTMPVFAEEQADLPTKTRPITNHLGEFFRKANKRRPLYINGEWRHYWGLVENDLHYVDATQLKSLFGITNINSNLLENATCHSLISEYLYVPLGDIPKYYPNIKLYFEPLTKSLVITTDGSDPQTNLPKDVQDRIYAYPEQQKELEKELDAFRKKIIGNVNDVNNSEPRPIYKGSHDEEYTDKLNWVWDETYKCWIRNSAGVNVKIGYSDGSDGGFLLGDDEEKRKRFFKYYELYGIPSNLGSTPALDANENPINISDYIKDFQPNE